MQTPEKLAQLTAAFAHFARECRGSSPLYEVLATEIRERPYILSLLEEAEERQRRPNLLFAAVHDLLLRGTPHALAAYYPSVGGSVPPDAKVLETFEDFVRRHERELRVLISTRKTQTNEVRRAALLYPAIHMVSSRYGHTPIVLFDVGASAGLNLLMDRYTYDYGDHVSVGRGSSVVLDCQIRRGRPFPDLSHPPAVAHRAGIDLDPLDPRDTEDVRWLRACVWPAHTGRLRLLEGALTLAANDPPAIHQGEALELLPEIVDEVPVDLPVCVFHSATLAYFPEEDRRRFIELLDEIASRRPLSWVSLEGAFISPYDRLDHEHDLAPPDDFHFLLGFTEWTDEGRSDVLLARGEPHGRWIQWLR